MNRLRTCVIGAGHLGTIHTRLLLGQADTELVAVAEPLPAARQRIETQFQLPTVDDYRQLLGRIDAAIVATPTRFHHRVALDLLRNDVHVLIEKPITSTVGEAQQLVAEARARQLVLQVGHVERFNPVLAAAAPYLRSPRYIEAARCGPYSFRSTDIGVVLDLMIHDLDLVLSLVGSTVTHVSAVGTRVFGPHEDMAQARLQFANGCVANLRASRVSPDVERRMQVLWSEGSAFLDFAQGTARLLQHHPRVLAGEIDVQRLTPDQVTQMKSNLFQDYLVLNELQVPQVNAIQLEQAEFLDSIRSAAPVRVTGQQATDALAVANRIVADIARNGWNVPAGLPRAA